MGSADWDKPEELLRLPTSGISSLAAGTHSSAAVSGDGNLWLWGRVLAKVGDISQICLHVARVNTVR